MTTIVIAVLCAWFALSVAHQIPWARKRFTGPFNAFGILPFLSLFAPDPLDVDYHLTWRDLRDDGTFGGWQEANIGRTSRLRALWNPDGRDINAILTVTSELSLLNVIAPRSRAGERILLVSLPYLVLLNAATAQPRGAGSVARQFLIVETSGFGPNRQVSLGISSEVHALD